MPPDRLGVRRSPAHSRAGIMPGSDRAELGEHRHRAQRQRDRSDGPDHPSECRPARRQEPGDHGQRMRETPCGPAQRWPRAPRLERQRHVELSSRDDLALLDRSA